MYLTEFEKYLGTGEKNNEGKDLKMFLEEYDPKRYDSPCNTVDNVIFTYVEENGKKKINKVLLIKRANHPSIGWWALPGGFVDYKENLETAAMRELEEETNLKDVRGVQFATFGEYDRDPRTRIITTAYVFVEEEGKLTATAGDDASDAKWYDIDIKYIGESPDSTKVVKKLLYDITFRYADIKPSARVEVTEDYRNLLTSREYKIVDNNLIAADHAAIILQAWDFVNERI